MDNFHKDQYQSLLVSTRTPDREMITEPNRKLRNNNLMCTKILYIIKGNYAAIETKKKKKLCSNIYG